MYPVFFILYKGKDVKRKMHFKKLALTMPEESLNALYKEVDIVSRNRQTDLAESNIRYILKEIEDGQSVVDIGCSKGYLLNRIRQRYANASLEGLDLENQLIDKRIHFTRGSITALPFADNAFDIVICTHTIEHIVSVDLAIQELVRIAKKKLIVVTPCQKYFYFTLDGHVQFFYRQEDLLRHFALPSFTCIKLDGDWVYVGRKSQ
jgi:ubiquinone/menaquinone biosynthesis C-methylase UbiE